MREQPGFLLNQRSHCREILDRRFVPERRKSISGRAITFLRAIAKREQSLRAVHACGLTRDPEDVLRYHVGLWHLARRFREDAIPAGVAAQLRQRDESLRRERDDVAVAGTAQSGGLFHQRSQRT